MADFCDCPYCGRTVFAFALSAHITIRHDLGEPDGAGYVRGRTPAGTDADLKSPAMNDIPEGVEHSGFKFRGAAWGPGTAHA